jgi:hypothetical protein
MAWFVPVFVAGWFTMLTLLSLVGGWNALAGPYRDLGDAEGRAYRVSSISIKRGLLPIDYGNCVSVRISSGGVRLAVWLPFRWFHPPLFIPWTAIPHCEGGRHWLRKCTTIQLADPPTTIRFYGRAGRDILATYDNRALSTGAVE